MKIGSKKKSKTKHTKSKKIANKKITKDKKSKNTKVKATTKSVNKWLILQLNDNYDISEHYENIKMELSNIFGSDVEYFIPLHTEKIENKPVSLILFEGYVFVKCNNNELDLFTEEYDYIRGPLLQNNKAQYVYDKDINKFREQIENNLINLLPEKGQKVIPKVGVFKNLEGEVLSVNKKDLVARVLFKQASRVVQASINIVNLEFLTND